MNVNEVISTAASSYLVRSWVLKHPIHLNDDVNMSQSSNDTFVTAMHIAAYQMTTRLTLPALGRLQSAPRRQVRPVDVGRHRLAGPTFRDATPLTVGRKWSGYAAALAECDRFRGVRDPGLTVAAGDGRDRRSNWPQRARRVRR